MLDEHKKEPLLSFLGNREVGGYIGNGNQAKRLSHVKFCLPGTQKVAETTDKVSKCFNKLHFEMTQLVQNPLGRVGA